MKRSCSDTLMYFHNENRPFSESHHRLALHLCDLEYNPLSHYKTFHRVCPAVYATFEYSISVIIIKIEYATHKQI